MLKFRRVVEILGKAGFLIPRPDSRYSVAFNLICSVLTATVVSILVYYYEASATRHESQKIQFIQEANLLDEKVSKYLALLDDNRSVAGDPTQDIVSNLIRQYQLVDYVAPQLKKRDRYLVHDYKKQLTQFREDLPDSTSVLRMQHFVNDLRAMAFSQEKLKDKLAD